jgi:outer membrane immunogenic protein
VVAVPSTPQTSFAGPYAGLEFGSVSSSGDETVSAAGGTIFAPDVSFTDGDALGAFAGYNAQSGSIVYGGELRYLDFDDLVFGGFEGNRVIDARGRAGFVAGPVLLYGALGWSWWTTSDGIVDGNLDGLNYGIGVEYKITDRFLVGVDYTLRKVSGNLTNDREYDGDLDTLSLRAGMRF